MTTVGRRSGRRWRQAMGGKGSQAGTLLNLHIAGVVVLGLVNLYLLVHMALAWRAANSENAQALADQKIAMKTAEIARQPLEGLDEKLAQATKDADKFYQTAAAVFDLRGGWRSWDRWRRNRG